MAEHNDTVAEYWTFGSFVNSACRFFIKYENEYLSLRWYLLVFLVSFTPLLPDILTNINAVLLIPLALGLLIRDIVYGNGIALDMKNKGVGKALPQASKNNCIYLDYNATTPVFPEVAEAMKPYVFGSCFGNPSSSHVYGKGCKEALEKARKRVAALIGAQTSEIIFESCGSEADFHAIESCVSVGKQKLIEDGIAERPHVISSTIEHPAVSKCLNRLRDRGEIDVTYVGVDNYGVVNLKGVEEALKPNTVLVTVMHANNEVGTIQPILDISLLCQKHGRALLHTDAAQSVGKIPVNVGTLGIDLMTLAAHKYGGPKGVAALYVRKGTPFEPMLLGGPQESGRRAGTENVPLIVGLGQASCIAEAELGETMDHMKKLRNQLQQYLINELPPGSVRVHGPKSDNLRLPNTLSIGFKGISVGCLKPALDPKVACSAGAACHGSGKSISAVLQAMNVPEEYGFGTLRISLGRHTTEADIMRAGKAIKEEVLKLQKAGGQ
mmetsp:Transcript_28085/g.36465  ORF Transcript_28085/g.36465 Transcript_28085/m.36465 type:complete len:496 (+) Transcript_28085:3-1490(+)